MSEEQNKFDEFIREKFSSENFPFDEENWERVEEKIDSDKRKKKFWWISLVFLFGLMAGVGIMLPFINLNSQPETRTVVQIVSKQQPDAVPLNEAKNNAAEPKHVQSDETSISNGISTEKSESSSVPSIQFSPIQKNKIQPKEKQPVVSIKEPSITLAPKDPAPEKSPVQPLLKQPLISTDDQYLVLLLKNLRWR